MRVADDDGAAALNTNRIAEIAGVSIGSVYQYFPDKQAIYAALHDRHVAEIGRVVEETVVAYGDAPLQDLVRALLEALVRAHAAHPGLDEVLALRPRRGGGGGGLAPRLRGALRLVLEARRGAERARALEPKLYVLTAMIDALAHAAARRPPSLPLHVLVGEATRAVLGYLP